MRRGIGEAPGRIARETPPRITRRGALRAGAAVAGVGLGALAGCFGRRPGFDALEDGFEEDFAWETAAAIGPEVPPGNFEWTVERSRERAHSGEWSLRIFTEGDHDDGTAWAVRGVPVEPGRAYEATVTVQAWSPSESFNHLRDLVARLGREPPEAEEDFPPPGQNSTGISGAPYGGLREPLHQREGWLEYTFEWTTPDLESDRLHLAVGVAVVWEADATHFVDDVRVEFAPADG